MGKLSFYARKRIVNLHLLGINISQIVRKLNEEDGIIVSRPAVSLFLSRFKRTGSLYDRPRKGRNPILVIRHFDVIDEEIKKNDELSSLELQRILLARCNISLCTNHKASAKKTRMDLERDQVLPTDQRRKQAEAHGTLLKTSSRRR